MLTLIFLKVVLWCYVWFFHVSLMKIAVLKCAGWCSIVWWIIIDLPCSSSWFITSKIKNSSIIQVYGLWSSSKLTLCVFFFYSPIHFFLQFQPTPNLHQYLKLPQPISPPQLQPMYPLPQHPYPLPQDITTQCQMSHCPFGRSLLLPLS